MTYLYHVVPKDQEGLILEPLNKLKKSRPELYDKKVKKYEGREHIMGRKIPILDCLWNDVLHLSPIPPNKLKLALIEAGMEDREWSFYKIDPVLLDPNNTVTYLHKDIGYTAVPDVSEFVPFSSQDLPELSQIPETTKQYWKEQYDRGKKPLIFLGIPHILYEGSIDVSNIEIVTV